MAVNGTTVMMTVEQAAKDSVVSAKDAVNAWMEFDKSTEEIYICLRELGNWNGQHKDIHVVSNSPLCLSFQQMTSCYILSLNCIATTRIVYLFIFISIFFSFHSTGPFSTTR